MMISLITGCSDMLLSDLSVMYFSFRQKEATFWYLFLCGIYPKYMHLAPFCFILWHMHTAFLFMPLPRAATSTNCSTNVLLNTSLHATSCTATTLWSSSHDLRPSARSHLSDPLSINNLLCLSPNMLGMDIYLINQITSLDLNSNNIICDHTFMRLSKLLSSLMGWRLKRPRLREATILSLFQPPGVYKQVNFSQIFQYQPCSYLDNISSPSLHLCLLPAILDMLFPVPKTVFPEVETLPSSAPSVSS